MIGRLAKSKELAMFVEKRGKFSVQASKKSISNILGGAEHE